jgi:hypothetical protein
MTQTMRDTQPSPPNGKIRAMLRALFSTSAERAAHLAALGFVLYAVISIARLSRLCPVATRGAPRRRRSRRPARTSSIATARRS